MLRDVQGVTKTINELVNVQQGMSCVWYLI